MTMLLLEIPIMVAQVGIVPKTPEQRRRTLAIPLRLEMEQAREGPGGHPSTRSLFCPGKKRSGLAVLLACVPMIATRVEAL